MLLLLWGGVTLLSASSWGAEEVGTVPLSSLERYLRTESVLERFHLSDAADVFPVIPHRRQSATRLMHHLQWLDPQAAFSPYFEIQGQVLRTFRDPGVHRVPDFEVTLLDEAGGDEPNLPDFHIRLIEAKKNSPAFPLRGLRIALDPGHMGSEPWDSRTGKFVRDQRGRILSEGIMALQTALLLEQTLKAWGAEVVLTRRSLAPVTAQVFEKLDLVPYAESEIRGAVQDSWFLSLLEAGKVGSSELFHAFELSGTWKSYFRNTDSNRSRYFILREDLRSRAKVIQNSDADLALVIHFDTSDPPGNSNGLSPGHRDGTKVYVSGAYSPSEMGSREQRFYLLEHLTDYYSTQASLNLGRSVVSQLSTELQIPLETGSGGGSSILVEPGIFARNLGVSRRVTHRPLTYVECLFYNDPLEFEWLLEKSGKLEIDGKSYFYSERLKKVADALATGILNFVSNYQ